ncbi:MAG: phosphotransferase [Bacteroidales bacterium]|nr:phosphotransferase [Bacteroidales bacterium]
MKRILFFLLVLPFAAHAQLSNDDVMKYDHRNASQYRNEINIPGFDGYQTLKCDFHIHTVFSDGTVWPSVRVHEAWTEGLDVIAITDHIEYRPFRDIVVSDNDKSYEIAAEEGERYGIMVIKGAEITRSKPLGHLNALFISDADALAVDDPLEAIDIADRQGAYIIWNHPGWPDNKSTFYPVHGELIKAGKIDAYEVYNYMESYPLTFDWYAQYGIAPMANTDIHGPVAMDYDSGEGWMRPMTLVFASEKTQEALKEALEAKRTLALFQGNLVGDKEYLSKLVSASLKTEETAGRLSVTNISDITYTMTLGDDLYIFPAGKTVIISRPEGELTVQNCLWGNGKHLTYGFR